MPPSRLDEDVAWLYDAARGLDDDGLKAALIARLGDRDLPEEDRQRLAWHMAQARHQAARNPAADGDNTGHAETALDGTIRSMDANFEVFMRQAVPDWPGQKLPFEIFWTDSLPYHGMTFGKLFIRIRALDDGYALTVREDRRLTLLSRREQEVVRLVVDGQTFKQVAEQLDLAISTVSTHLYRVYDKLGISKRSELVQWAREQGQDKPGATPDT